MVYGKKLKKRKLKENLISKQDHMVLFDWAVK